MSEIHELPNDARSQCAKYVTNAASLLRAFAAPYNAVALAQPSGGAKCWRVRPDGTIHPLIIPDEPAIGYLNTNLHDLGDFIALLARLLAKRELAEVEVRVLDYSLHQPEIVSEVRWRPKYRKLREADPEVSAS